MATDERPSTVEGWQTYLTPGARKAHYIVDATSLCRKVGFYFAEVIGPLTPGNAADCAACRKLVQRRIQGVRDGE